MNLAAPILIAAAALWAAAASAAEPVRLTVKDHRFTPAEVSVPAHERFRIEVTNQDATPAEFESGRLRAEKIIVPGGTIVLMAGPLQPGRYDFADEYHPDTAKGVLTAADRTAEK